MNRLIFLSILSITALMFSGCAAMINYATMPEEKEDIKDYKSEVVDDKTKSDLFVYTSKASYPANRVTVHVEDNFSEPLAFEYYLYFKTEPGHHWIYQQDTFNLSSIYTCVNTNAGKKNVIDLAYPTKSVSTDNMDFERMIFKEKKIYTRTQVGQKTKEISSVFSYKNKIDSVNVEVIPSGDKYLNSIKKALEESFSKLSIPKGNDFKVKISMLNDGAEPKYIIYGMSSYGYYKAILERVKLEFFKNGEKIDEYISEGYYNKTKGIGIRISSYIACKYFSKQYPLY